MAVRSLPKKYISALTESTLQGAVIPVLAGSGLTNNGAVTLLDAIVDYLPSPAAAGPSKLRMPRALKNLLSLLSILR